MSRTITPAMATALAAGDVRPCLFFEGEFPSGVLRLWTGVGAIVWDAKLWSGAGTLLGIGAIEETTDVVASGTVLTLAGVPSDMVALAIVDAKQGLPGRIWLGLLATNGLVIADPVAMFTGRLDVPTITDGADTCTIQVTYESRLIDLQRSREWRYTDESQKTLVPGDRGFEYVTTIQQTDIAWGRA